MHRINWKSQHVADGGDDSSSLIWEGLYQKQKKFNPKSPTINRIQCGQLNGNAIYRRWLRGQEYAHAAPRSLHAAEGGNFYNRRYSLDAPPSMSSSTPIPPSLPPDSIIYYKRKRFATPETAAETFIGESLDDAETLSSSSTLLYHAPPASDNAMHSAFYLNRHRIQKIGNEEIILNTERVVRNLTLFGRFLEVMQSWPLPHVSFTTACVLVLLATFISPRLWAQNIIFPVFRLSFGTLYPAYASYKAVRTKNVKEYVKWMMYWIVYAFFTCIETFTDIFLAWFPFYYEVKVIIVLWLLSPATKGSSTLYRKFVHPMLTRREQEIDEYLNQARERGYSAVLQLGTKGVNYATSVIMQTALKSGGNLVQTIRRSYSLSDLSEPDVHRTQDEIDDVVHMRSQPRILRPRAQAGIARSGSGTRHSTDMYFSEVDAAKGGDGFSYNIRSSEDISSGYSSAEPVSASLSRTSSMTNATKTRLKGRRTEIIQDPQCFRTKEHDFPRSSVCSLEHGTDFNDYYTEKNMQKFFKVFKETRTEAFLENENAKKTGPPNNPTKSNMHKTIDGNNVVVGSYFGIKNGKNALISSESACENYTIQQLQKEHELKDFENILPLNVIVENREISESILPDEICSVKENYSISNVSTIYNTLESSDEDNGSDEFSDALPTLVAYDDHDDGDGEEKIKEYEGKLATEDQKNKLSSIESFESPKTPPTPRGLQMSEKSKFNTNQMQETLKEINESFRATIHIPMTTVASPSSALTTATNRSTAKPRQPITHKKGKAPAPPLPLCPIHSSLAHSVSAATASNALDFTGDSSRSSSPAPSSTGGILKTNLFRFGSTGSVNEKQNDAVVEGSNHSKSRFETQL